MALRDLVSVTVVTYNSGRFIKRCLESVLEQKYGDLEVVVIDNASTDGTVDILEQFADRCKIYYNDENLGFAAAQNQGASRLHVFQFIHACKQNDLIRTLDAQACLAEAKEALDKGDANETAKFLRAVMAKERIELNLIRRYIEFLRKAERPQLARRECKTLAAQYLAVPRNPSDRYVLSLPGTVRYRLRRITDVCGYDLMAGRDRYVVQVALTLGRLDVGANGRL